MRRLESSDRLDGNKNFMSRRPLGLLELNLSWPVLFTFRASGDQAHVGRQQPCQLSSVLYFFEFFVLYCRSLFYVITPEFQRRFLHVCTPRMSTTLTTTKLFIISPAKKAKKSLTCICLCWWSYLPPSYHTFQIIEAKNQRTVLREQFCPTVFKGKAGREKAGGKL